MIEKIVNRFLFQFALYALTAISLSTFLFLIFTLSLLYNFPIFQPKNPSSHLRYFLIMCNHNNSLP